MTVWCCARTAPGPLGCRADQRSRAAVAQALPSVDVREAHVDVHPPYLGDVVTPGAVVLPLLLAPGHHVSVDIARAADRVAAFVTPALGPARSFTSLLAARWASSPGHWATTTSWCSRPPDRRSRDPSRPRMRWHTSCRPGWGGESMSGTAPRAHRGSTSLWPDCAQPSRPAHRGSSYLLAPGHFHERVRECGADEVTAPLLDGRHPIRAWWNWSSGVTWTAGWPPLSRPGAWRRRCGHHAQHGHRCPARADPGTAHRAHLNNAGSALLSQRTLDAMTDHLRREAEIGGYEAAERRRGRHPRHVLRIGAWSAALPTRPRSSTTPPMPGTPPSTRCRLAEAIAS